MTELVNKSLENILIHGEPLAALPEDLYVPPAALKIIVEDFQGPLDLLLYLIKKQNIDILNIPIALIATQFAQYIQLMERFELELAAEYLLMAAMLAEIKSKTLLPKSKTEEGEEVDPRAELVKRLQEYEKFKKAADTLDELPRLERDFFLPSPKKYDINVDSPSPQVSFDELMKAFGDVLKRADQQSHHHISREPISVRERMTQILDRLTGETFTEFHKLFDVQEGKMGVVVTFVAILELVKQRTIELVQSEPFQPLHVKACL